MAYRSRRPFERGPPDRGGRRPRFTGPGRGGDSRYFDTPARPTESEVVVNYNKLQPYDLSQEVNIRVYDVSIRSASFVIRKDDAGNKVIDPATGKLARDFIPRDGTVCDDEKYKKKFFESNKPWRIFTELVKEEQKADPSFHLDVSISKNSTLLSHYHL